MLAPFDLAMYNLQGYASHLSSFYSLDILDLDSTYMLFVSDSVLV